MEYWQGQKPKTPTWVYSLALKYHPSDPHLYSVLSSHRIASTNHCTAAQIVSLPPKFPSELDCLPHWQRGFDLCIQYLPVFLNTHLAITNQRYSQITKSYQNYL